MANGISWAGLMSTEPQFDANLFTLEPECESLTSILNVSNAVKCFCPMAIYSAQRY